MTTHTELERVGPKEAVDLGAMNLITYGHLFFPRTFRQESPKYHYDVGAALYSTARYNAFEIFRDGAKTTLLRCYASQRISYAISRTIMYVSVSQLHASMSLRWMRRQIQYNRPWAETFGLRPGTKWTDEWLEVMHGVEEVPITMLAMGVTGQIRGFNPDDFRPDLIIADDVLSDENTATPEQRQKLEALLFGALFNSLAPETEAPLAKAVFINTPFNKNDSIEKCMGDPQWNGMRVGCFDDEGRSRWEARYPTQTFKTEKEAAVRRGQYSIWMREKECKLVSSIDKAFDTRRLQYWQVLPEYMDTIIAIDPASSDNVKADDHAIVALGFRGVDCYILAYHLDKRVMPDQAAHHFFELTMRYSPMRCAVESIAYQRILAWYLEQEMIRRRIFVAIDKVQDKRRKANRILTALMHYVAYGHLWIHASMSELLTQMDDYDPQIEDQPDDLLDAIAMGIVSYNPQLRAGQYIDGEARQVLDDDDSAYGAPVRLTGVP